MSISNRFSDLAEVIITSYSGRDPGFTNRLQFWVGYFDNQNITELKTEDIEDGIDALVLRGKFRTRTTRNSGNPRKTVSTIEATGQPLAPSTINRYVACLGTMFRELRRMRLLPRGFANPMRGVQRQAEGPGRSLSVSVDDVKRLVASCRVSRNNKLASIVAFACTTGWRLGTIQSLRWADINLNEGVADASRTKNGTPHRAVLLPWVITELKRIQPSLAQPGDLVFGKNDFRKAWNSALHRADLPKEWTFHHCRHIAASILAQSGASVVTIMQCLNHKTPLMAMRYSHLNIESLRQNLNQAWG